MFTKEQKLVMVTFVFHNKAKMIAHSHHPAQTVTARRSGNITLFFNNSTFLHIDFDV